MSGRTGRDGGVVAVVPARGGSKSIPRKNLRAFAGHPLLAWSVAAAREAACVDRVLVSTDDPGIRDVAIACGAEAPFLRPAALAGDETPDLPVFAHALDWLEREEGWRPEVVVQLRPTSPVRPRGLVDAAVARLTGDPGATAVRAVAPSGQNPYKMWRPGPPGGAPYLQPLLGHPCPEPYNLPRQALPETYWQTGHVDAARRATVVDGGSMTGARVLPLVVAPRYAIDLDTPHQWAQAEWAAGQMGDAIVRPAPAIPDLRRFRLLVLDFDGVLTDNRVWVGQDGHEAVACDRGDGLGLAALRRAGFPVAVLSTETNPVVAARCRKLQLPCAQGLDDKGAALRALAAEYDLSLSDIIYVGNDVNDRDCLRLAGLAVVPADAHPDARREAALVLARPGGRGAVRELCDLLLEAHAP